MQLLQRNSDNRTAIAENDASCNSNSYFKKGVSVIGLPGDLTSQKVANIDSSNTPYHTQPVVSPQITKIKKIASLLNKANKITIFCGIGAQNAHDEVVELSQSLNAPVAYSFKGKMGIQHNNPNEVGMTGLLGLPSGYYSMQEAEILLLLARISHIPPLCPKTVISSKSISELIA